MDGVFIFSVEGAALNASVKTFRFSDLVYNSIALNEQPEAVLNNPGSVSLDVFPNGRAGESSTSIGEVTLNNFDGQVDFLKNFVFDGRDAEIAFARNDQDNPDDFNNRKIVFKGTVERAIYSLDEVIFRFRDNRILLDIPIQDTRFAGTNILPGGLEGTEDNIGGDIKPQAWGQVFNIAPPLVNTSKLIYQVHDSSIKNIQEVYEGGISGFTRLEDYSNIEDLLNEAPGSGNYRVLKSSSKGAFFRLGSGTEFQVTCDVLGDSADYTATTNEGRLNGPFVSNVPELCDKIVRTSTEIAQINTASVASLKAKNPAPAGEYIKRNERVSQVISRLLASIGADFFFDEQQRLTFVRLEVPSGRPVQVFKNDLDNLTLEEGEVEMTDLTIGPLDPSLEGLPPKETVLSYKENHTVQTSGLVGAIAGNQERKSFVGMQFRKVTQQQSIELQGLHKLSQSVEIETKLINRSDATAEAARRQNLFEKVTDAVVGTVSFDPVLFNKIRIGDVVKVISSRYNLTNGVKLAIIGVEVNLGQNTPTITYKMAGKVDG